MSRGRVKLNRAGTCKLMKQAVTRPLRASGYAFLTLKKLTNLANVYDAGIYAQSFDNIMQYDSWDE